MFVQTGTYQLVYSYNGHKPGVLLLSLTVIMPGHKAMLLSVHLSDSQSVCPIFFILSHLLDERMLILLLKMHSLEGSTYGHPLTLLNCHIFQQTWVTRLAVNKLAIRATFLYGQLLSLMLASECNNCQTSFTDRVMIQETLH